MPLTTVFAPNFFVMPETSMAKSLIGKIPTPKGQTPKKLPGPTGKSVRFHSRFLWRLDFDVWDLCALVGARHIHRLARVQIARGSPLEERLDHEDEFGAVVPIVEDWRGVFRPG